jgi:lipopolysaccharide export system protein LptA
MRSLRWLILLAIGLLAAFVGYTYHLRTADQSHTKVAPAAAVPDGVNVQSEEWTFTQTENGREKARMRAKNMRQMKEQSKIELEGVTLEIPHKDGKQYDRVKTQRAEFDQKNEILYADGEVEIFMDVPEGAEPTGRLVKIITSGLSFEKAGKAHTEREVRFEFDRGSGRSTGAMYDTSVRELHMLKNVELIWKGAAKDAIPMKINSGNAIYKESEQMVYLLPTATLIRSTLTMDASATVVKLDKGRIDIVEAQKAKGIRDDPQRKIEYGADYLVMNFSETGQISKITGDTNARLVSTAKGSRTDVTSDKVVLDFLPGEKESALTKAVAGGKAVLQSTPIDLPGETRIVKSELVELFMREGGQEIDRAETAAPSTLELIPNRPAQPHRWLSGDRFFIVYGKENTIDKFNTTNAATRTQPANKPGAKKPEPLALTWSRELQAQFDPKTSQLAKLTQKTDFRYEAGDRRAKSHQADLDQSADTILLTGAARVWDPTGSTTGDTINLNQKTGDFIAEGSVTSTRLPDKKPAANNTAMLSHEEATQATANKMTAANNNRYIRYEGNAVAWQGSNRVTADRIEIDRDNEVLKAFGNVVSQFVDRPQDSKKKKPSAAQNQKKAPANPAAPGFTVVRAPELIYTEVDRVALFKENAHLTRQGLSVKGKQIRAFLNESSEESTLSRAVVDGAVEIVQTNPQRTRTGKSEHADYYPEEEKTVLMGGRPLLIDSLKGRTEGRELIYFANNEKLIVDGVEQKRTESVIKRK